MTKRRLEATLNEHKTDENSVLYRHSCLTNHEINYSNPCIFTKGVHYFRLRIKVANPTSIVGLLCLLLIYIYFSFCFPSVSTLFLLNTFLSCLYVLPVCDFDCN